MAVVNQTEIAAEDFPAYLRACGERLANGSFAPALKEMKEEAETGILENFHGSHDGGGIAWAPRKRNYPWPILIKTGHLKRSATDEGEPGHIEQIGDRDAYTGTDVPYAAYHQHGTSRMVARPFEEINDQRVDAMEAILVDYVLDTIF